MHMSTRLHGRPDRALVAASVLMIVAAGCASTAQSSAAPVAEPSPTTVAIAQAEQPAASAAAAAATVPTCSPEGAAPSPATLAAWAGPVGGTPAIVPIPVSTQSTVGPNRFLYSVANPSNEPIAAADLPTRVRFYALERDLETPTAETEGIFLDTGMGHGLYRTSVEFDCAGEWGAEVEADMPDGSVASQRMRFTVLADASTPGIGEPAPRSDSLTASTPEEVATVSTDPDPFPGAYERTIGEVVSSGEPSIVFFATPAFCQTGICGPTMELVKSVVADYVDRVAFVNVEPYALHMTENGLQPALDEAGRLQPVQAVLDYGLRTEPFLFVVDAEGDVFATFEAVVGEDELRAALDEVVVGSV
jgi:hypothetical protein